MLLREKLHSQIVAFIRNNELFNCKEDLDIIIESFINNGLIQVKGVGENAVFLITNEIGSSQMSSTQEGSNDGP